MWKTLNNITSAFKPFQYDKKRNVYLGTTKLAASHKRSVSIAQIRRKSSGTKYNFIMAQNFQDQLLVQDEAQSGRLE